MHEYEQGTMLNAVKSVEAIERILRGAGTDRHREKGVGDMIVRL